MTARCSASSTFGILSKFKLVFARIRKILINTKLDSFATYRAMIAYLHVPIVPFLPLPSDFLVELAKTDRPEGDPFELVERFPAEWLQEQFDALKGEVDWVVDPCPPHAMYRLADLYNLEDLRDLSLGFIIRSLTIENVSLLFRAPLSLIQIHISVGALCRSPTSSSVRFRLITTMFEKPCLNSSWRTG